ncbi:hypothetical protein DNL40_02735 [Xylanimonas oleitrophica]|uniref:Peptide chain release factor 1 n=1 Tax=Xylanimonas oleitrophica TaxID=2607479 RepID=A0A2W5X4B0_9MICO|nr:hypothetical protein [Xylanimonas oleitrophica]PZR55305.1 hypothetical protein DNL40_02735 [Xylanimonas oleitrophica]
MKIDWIKPLIGHPGPFATVYLDSTRSADAADKDVVTRWNGVRRALADQGAPDGVLAAVEDAALRRTRKPGAHGRVIIADESGVLVDKALRTPPAVPAGVWSTTPALLQAALAADEEVDALKVEVDRTGADLRLVGQRAWDEARTFESPHDEITQSDRRSNSHGNNADRGGSATIEARALDSWERNAEAVAREIEKVVADERPEIVLITGDVRTVNLVKDELNRPVAEITVEVPGGGRNAGVREDTFVENVEDALDSYRERRREKALSALRQGLGREQGAVTSLDDVVAVLARGQVEELVLSEDVAYDAQLRVEDEGAGGPLNGRCLWIGPDPLSIATSKDTLVDAGVTDGIEELPAAVALIRAAFGQDAGLTFAPEGSVELIDGVGATLRWDDEGTPREVAATMSGDDERLQ